MLRILIGHRMLFLVWQPSALRFYRSGYRESRERQSVKTPTDAAQDQYNGWYRLQSKHLQFSDLSRIQIAEWLGSSIASVFTLASELHTHKLATLNSHN